MEDDKKSHLKMVINEFGIGQVMEVAVNEGPSIGPLNEEKKVVTESAKYLGQSFTPENAPDDVCPSRILPSATETAPSGVPPVQVFADRMLAKEGFEPRVTMRVVLPPGAVLAVCTEDEHGERNDGALIIELNDEKKVFEVRTDWPDTSGRVGVLYREEFGPDAGVDGIAMGPCDAREVSPHTHTHEPISDLDGRKGIIWKYERSTARLTIKWEDGEIDEGVGWEELRC